MKLIDISGFGHSGKTTVTNLFSEVDATHVHDPNFEFGLLRLPDGLIDLKRNVLDNWTPIKSDIQIKRFLNLVKKLNSNYSENLNSNFYSSSIELINNIVMYKTQIHWYDDLYNNEYDSNMKMFTKKAFQKLGVLNRFRKLKKQRSTNNSKNKNEVNMVTNVNFNSLIKKYLNCLLSFKDNIIVTNNAFEPFNPSESMSFFNDAYSIIVDRDPRDIYLSSINSDNLFVPDFEKNNTSVSLEFIQNQKKDFLGSNNIDMFIWRQKQLRDSIKKDINSDRILRINYEDLIFNYEKTVNLIFKFSKINPNSHLNKFKFFDPKISKSNVNLWKKHKDNSDILLIEKELSNYLYKSDIQ